MIFFSAMHWFGTKKSEQEIYNLKYLRFRFIGSGLSLFFFSRSYTQFIIMLYYDELYSYQLFFWKAIIMCNFHLWTFIPKTCVWINMLYLCLKPWQKNWYQFYLCDIFCGMTKSAFSGFGIRTILDFFFLRQKISTCVWVAHYSD